MEATITKNGLVLTAEQERLLETGSAFLEGGSNE